VYNRSHAAAMQQDRRPATRPTITSEGAPAVGFRLPAIYIQSLGDWFCRMDSLLLSVLFRGIVATVLLIILAPIGILVYDHFRFRGMPPSPPKQPFLGNKNLIPASKPWLQMEAWSKQYGPMYTLWQGRNPTIVISDPQIAVDLMEKRSNIYSSRPRMVIMGDIFTRNRGLLTAPYGEHWRRLRKINHIGLMSKAALSYRPIQEWESQRLAHDLLVTPEHFAKHIQRYAASVVMTVAYARRVDSMDDVDVQKILEMMQYMASLNVRSVV